MRTYRAALISIITAMTLIISGCGGNTTAETAISNDASATQSDTSDNAIAPQEPIVDEQNPLNLDDAGVARVQKILDEFGADDFALNALTNCVSKYYDDLNATFFDANLREVPMANVQDCTEELNPDVACRPADNGTGPVCGLANKRTGYSLASIFGYMAG
jgi:hypothetical protein